MARLSVCITTRNREAYIGETLESILSQCPPDVEVVVVDGASTDGTVAVVRGVAARYPQLRLETPAENSGLDADFDKAVQAAQGTYCWLFSDDDLLVPGAIQRVLDACAGEPTAVIVDASVHDAGFERTFDWSRARLIAQSRQVILAGGLTPENVGQAIGEVQPFAVDVSSGVELRPGVKDHALLRAFIAAAKGTGT